MNSATHEIMVQIVEKCTETFVKSPVESAFDKFDTDISTLSDRALRRGVREEYERIERTREELGMESFGTYLEGLKNGPLWREVEELETLLA
jgi:hypothetical protein